MSTTLREKSEIDYTPVKSLLSYEEAAFVRLCGKISGASLNDVVKYAIKTVMESGFVIVDGAYLTKIPAKANLADLHAMSSTNSLAEKVTEKVAETIINKQDDVSDKKDFTNDSKAIALLKSGAKAAPPFNFNIRIEPMKTSKSLRKTEEELKLFERSEERKIPSLIPENPTKPKPTQSLYVDLVPQTSWFANLRSELKKSEWDSVRKIVYQRAGNCCEICGGKGSTHAVEAHERWSFDNETTTQTLIRIEALCPKCHLVTHIGNAERLGKGELAMEHLMKVNTWDNDQAKQHISEAFSVWRERGVVQWDFDMKHLLQFNVSFSDETMSKLKINAESRTFDLRY